MIVVAAIIERGGWILLSQRGRGALPGFWEFPGGKREEGESDAEALRRELAEELGLELDASAVGPRVWRERNGAIELRFHRCAYPERARPRALDCAQFRWVRRPDLPRYPFPPADRRLVAALSGGWTPAGAVRPSGVDRARIALNSRPSTTEVAMAKAKRERRTSIRTLPPDRVLGALDALEQAERAHEQKIREPAEAESATPPTAKPTKD
jgi:8-oxo-dGTP diphosphatase